MPPRETLLEEESISIHDHSQDNDHDDDDGFDIEAIQELANNPMMERVQRALKKQLQTTFDRIKRESLEQQQELRNVKKQREDCGVELYGMQQQLARLQSRLDGSSDEFVDLNEHRDKSEKQLENVKGVQVDSRERLSEVNKAISKRKAELDDLITSTKQAKLFNRETKNEIAISKRAASKAEEVVTGLQKGKLKQDLYIDSLNERIKFLEQDTNLVEEELEIQKNLTADADKVIQETMIDLDTLVSEKKRHVHQWDSSILALGRRDQALTAMSDAVKRAENTLKDRKNEITYIIREIKQNNEEKETMVLTRNKFLSEGQFIEEELAKVEVEQEAIAGRFEILSNSMTKTSEIEGSIDKEIKLKKAQVFSLNQKIETVTRERKELEERTGFHHHDQKSISQTIINLTDKEKVVSTHIHDQEIESANIQNQLARLRIDALNVEARTSSLENRLKEELDILNDKDMGISNLETEIRRRHDEIQAKMNTLDRLNRKYEQMIDGIEEEEPLGPLESTIKTLQREIEEIKISLKNQQSQWIENQTKLIKLIDKTEEMESKKREIAAALNILQQKRLRLIQNINTNKTAVKIVGSRINNMRTDLSRLNELIGKNSQISIDLANNNSVTEMEIQHELKELKHESELLESKILEVKNEKDQILINLLEVEKQILSWEKKIQLEKEIQATLTSSDHAHEMKGMEKEIHRMKHRLDCLKREQDKIIREMELAIYKKEDIAVKYQYSKNVGVSSSKDITVAELKKKKTLLMKQKKDIENTTQKVLSREIRLVSDEENIRLSKEIEMIKDHNEKLQKKINSNLFEKQRLLAKYSRVKGLLKRYLALAEGDVEAVNQKKDQVRVEKRLALVEDKTKRIKNSIAGLRLKHCKYDAVFERVLTLVDDQQ